MMKGKTQKSSNIVHQYFKKEVGSAKILVKVNPLTFLGTEISVGADESVEIREMEFDSEIFEDLNADDFKEASSIEFNLYFSGLAGK
jgi:hypothetical protein